MLKQIFGKNGIGLSIRFLKLLGIFSFYLRKVATTFTFLSENMLNSKIGVFLLHKILMTDKKTHTRIIVKPTYYS